MHKRQAPSAGEGLNGFEPAFPVDLVDIIAARAEANGGRIIMPRPVIPTVDAMRYETPPHT